MQGLQNENRNLGQKLAEKDETIEELNQLIADLRRKVHELEQLTEEKDA